MHRITNPLILFAVSLLISTNVLAGTEVDVTQATEDAAKVVTEAAKPAMDKSKAKLHATKAKAKAETSKSGAADESVKVAALEDLPAAGEGREPYLLKDGDEIEVSVWQEDSLHKTLHVLPDGSITFPLAGRVNVAGFTVGEVEKKIEAKLGDFLADPVVNIVITGTNGNRVYVIGNVAKPGPVILDVPMNALQVLSLAGGLGRFADENAIKVLRATATGVDVLPVRYSDLIKTKDLSTNVQLRAGDTLIVP